MLLSVLIYGTMVTALLAVSALILEQAAKGRNLPTRFVWAAAVGGALVAVGVAFAPAATPAGDDTSTVMSLPRAAIAQPAIAIPVVETASTPLEARSGFAMPARVNAWIGIGWMLLSVTLLALACGAQLRLTMERRGWSESTVDGHLVRLSADRGPAVVGITHPVIVIPRWLLQMSESERALMLRHEAEHRAAGDSRLVAAAVLALILLPWNAPLWWIVARLRIALEIDCDRRVLESVPDVRPYASLLIDAGALHAPGRLAAVAFVSPFSFLERRIKAMTDRRPRGKARAIALAACATLLLTGACFVDEMEVTVIEGVGVEGLEGSPPPLAASGYALRPGDQIEIELYTSAGTEVTVVGGERSVDVNGDVFLPYAGTINVLGMNQRDLREVLTDRYSAFYRQPVLGVQVKLRVTVTGAVGAAGMYLLAPTARVIDAIAGAGGMTGFGDRRGVRLVRDGIPYVLNLHPAEIADSILRLPIQSGDWLDVPLIR